MVLAMSCPPKADTGFPVLQIDFSRFLDAPACKALADWRKWRWISTFGGDRVTPARHAVLQAFVGAPGRQHCPEHRRVQLTLSGKSYYAMEGKVYRTAPGTVFLFGANISSQREVHDLQLDAQSKILWLHLRKDTDSLTFEIRARHQRGVLQQPLPLSVKTGPAIRMISDLWTHCEADRRDALAWLLLKNALSSCCLEIIATASPKRSPNLQQQIIQSLKEYIQAHIGEDLRLERLARVAGYSPFFFHHLFRKHAGMTPQEYVNQTRLEYAKALLADNFTVEATAERVGISSIAYFRRFFKQRMRTSPGRWSKLAQGRAK